MTTEATKSKKPRGEYVANGKFFEAWEAAVVSGGGAEEVAKKFNMSAQSVTARVSKTRSLLREAGITEGIPSEMPKGGGVKTNPQELAALIAGFKPKATAEVASS